MYSARNDKLDNWQSSELTVKIYVLNFGHLVFVFVSDL